MNEENLPRGKTWKMGIGMPKFISSGYNSFKETCTNVREGWRMAKMAFKLARNVNLSKAVDTNDPEEFLNALKTSEGMPDMFKNLLSSVDNETLRKMMKVTMDTLSKKDPSDPEQPNETISKLTEIMAESKRKEQLEEDEAFLDRIEEAAKEQSEYINESIHKNVNNSEEAGEPAAATYHGNDNPFDKIDRSGLDKFIDVAMEESKTMVENMGYKMPEFNKDTQQSSENNETLREQNNNNSNNTKRKYENTNDKLTNGIESTDQSNNKDEPEFIPSQMHKDILGVDHSREDSSSKHGASQTAGATFRTAREYQESLKRKQGTTNGPGGSVPKQGKSIPPLTKMLGEELQKRFGNNWRDKVPTFMKDPSSGPVPDLGLGLTRQGNKDMLVQMSNVLRDLV